MAKDMEMLMQAQDLERKLIEAKQNDQYDQLRSIILLQQKIPIANSYAYTSNDAAQADLERWILVLLNKYESSLRAAVKQDELASINSEYLFETINELKKLRFDGSKLKLISLEQFLNSAGLSREKANKYAAVLIGSKNIESVEHLEQLCVEEQLTDSLKFMSDELDRKKVAFAVLKRTIKVGDIQIQDIREISGTEDHLKDLLSGVFAVGAMQTRVFIKLGNDRRQLQKENDVLNSLGLNNTIFITKMIGFSHKPSYLILEHFGQDLTFFLKPGSNILLPILKNFLSAVEFLHSKNICHLDLKPHNILVDSSSVGVSVL